MSLPSLPSLLSLGTAHSWNVSLVLLLLKATLILIAALGITLAMQRASAGARHLVWLVTLGALVLIPALTAWGPLRLEILPARDGIAGTPASPSIIEAPAATEPQSSLVIANAGSRSVVIATPSTNASANATAGMLATIRDASIWTLLLSIWGIGALAIVAALLWSAFTVRRLVRRSRPLDDPTWVNPLWEVSDRLGLPDSPRLLLSHDAKMPFACGLLQPTIVLPAECETWSKDRRLAVLLHELAHVRRHDMVGHTLGRLVCAVYWFHPLVWTAARQLRSESERACDDLALACGTRATDYAEHLLDIVTSVRRDGTPMVALAMARRKEFEGRMLAILDPELRHSTPSRRQSATLIATLAVISIVVGAAVPVQAPAQSPTRAQRASAPDTTSTAATRSGATFSDGRQKDLDVAHDVAHDVPRHVEVVEHDMPRSPKAAPAPAAKPEPAARPAERVAQRSDKSMSFEKAVESFTDRVINKVVPMAVSVGLQTASDAIANVTVRDLTTKAPQGSKAADDRPMLLAKVLRTDSSAELRRVAAWGLHEYAEQSVAAEALSNALRRDADERVREMAAWSLGQGDDGSIAVEALRAALHSDASVAVRRTAAWSLGSIDDEGAVSTLVAAFGDVDATVRSRAIWALGNIEPRQAPKQLFAMLSDKDARVRELTAWALYQIEDPAAAPALNAALRAETDKDLQMSYIRALASLGEKSVDAVRELLESPDPRIKSMAVHALAGRNATGPWPRPMPQPRPYP
ncbi:MAG: M56 family metallopeptidase [Gemmatimonadaceae bacterium]